ncbi:DUF4411 family protein [Deefgea salmonis]|uniref:DUF4411 family protein n=1 Tax=Deefgea salmonis TaxID=2875502 RepID=A0ABS8BIM3_9NEIS|nr:DUF4411 family protein [Deefgea salmonis]MCB5195567.1 DUF4411 family protein [Deefgea salmonis]
MQNKTRYLFDSDVLISSARLHYNPNYCELFWGWVAEGHKAGLFFSIDKVKTELLDGEKDPLKIWAESNTLNNFFHPSISSLPIWRSLSTHANDPKKEFQEGAKTKFLNVNKADAWLIAYAAHIGNYTIVSNEASAPNAKREIKLPDAAAWVDVKTIKLFDLLKIHATNNFTFKT